MAELIFQDNNVIPGMASFAERFLQVIKQRSDQADFGLDFQPRKDRKSKEVYLEATVKFRSLMGSGYPIRVRVHATPQGSTLHVGYSVSVDEVNAMVASLNSGNALDDAMRHNVNLKPENQRQLTVMLDAFEDIVYVPTVRDLMDVAPGRP